MLQMPIQNNPDYQEGYRDGYQGYDRKPERSEYYSAGYEQGKIAYNKESDHHGSEW
jgi:hypothetical protein